MKLASAKLAISPVKLTPANAERAAVVAVKAASATVAMLGADMTTPAASVTLTNTESEPSSR